MPTQWVDWSKTTRSKDYRGSGSFATFLIIGRTPAPSPPNPVKTNPPSHQPSASSSASSSPPSPTTTPSYGPRTLSPPPTSRTSKPTCA